MTSALDRGGILPVVEGNFHPHNGCIQEGNMLMDGDAATTTRQDCTTALGLQVENRKSGSYL